MNSMTGFGRAKLEKGEREYLVEIRSVNHKYTDITVKAPRTLLYLEEKIRKLILNKIARGKIEVYINYNNYGMEGKDIIINRSLAEKYISEIRELSQENNIKAEINAQDIIKLPDVLNMQIAEESAEKIWQELSECLENALENFVLMRSLEGIKIKQDIENRLQNIQKNVNEICELSTGLVEEYVVKLEAKIKEILKTDIVDETRLAQEIVIYSDKYSTEEETTRLKSHIVQFQNLLKLENIPCGKKADFLVQEMNREVNTIGSKSGKLEITNLVIEIKTTLEDIREQIQNVE